MLYYHYIIIIFKPGFQVPETETYSKRIANLVQKSASCKEKKLIRKNKAPVIN